MNPPRPRPPTIFPLQAAVAGLAAWLVMVPCRAEPAHRNEPLVNLAQACPGIVIELRYATSRNAAGSPLYPRESRCLARRSVAERLNKAQDWLRRFGLRLKIWDAYRPPAVQETLWNRIPNARFVARPETAMHTRGVAIDATLVDATGQELRMPTDFDVFTPAAGKSYEGADPVVARNLAMLQGAMSLGGFLGMDAEWWHFVARDYAEFGPIDAALVETE